MASQWTTTGRHSPSHLEVASPHPNPCTHSTRTPARLAPPSLIEFPAAVSGEIPHRAQGILISSQRAAEALQVCAVAAGSCPSGSGSYPGSGTDVEEAGDVWLQEPGYHHTQLIPPATLPYPVPSWLDLTYPAPFSPARGPVPVLLALKLACQWADLPPIRFLLILSSYLTHHISKPHSHTLKDPVQIPPVALRSDLSPSEGQRRASE